jgi:7,8-dihydropterin-6-yl-methyl-4-(beta-D-ribofuranosyl)aminobenzene 5'-phosphate synthase
MRLICLIDNSVAHASPLWGEHGLSFWIETIQGELLWDTGQSSAILQHNLEALGLAEHRPAALALSHAHKDHTGSLEVVLRRWPGLPVYAHADLFRERYSERDGKHKVIGIASQSAQLQSLAEWRLAAEPQRILPEIATTGHITPRLYPQGGNAHQLAAGDMGTLVQDAFQDDLSLVLRVRDGIALLCGCCHAGLRNTLETVRRQYAEPLVAIVGGTHLVVADDAEQRALIAALAALGSPRLYLNHCTGERALHALRMAFGDRVAPCPAGTVIEL